MDNEQFQKDQMQDARRIIREYLESALSATVAVRMTRQQWRAVLTALEIAGEM